MNERPASARRSLRPSPKSPGNLTASIVPHAPFPSSFLYKTVGNLN